MGVLLYIDECFSRRGSLDRRLSKVQLLAVG
jgi:hypothetical protein